MPGVVSDKDVIVGNITEVSPSTVQKFMRDRLAADPVAFFVMDRDIEGRSASNRD